MEHKILVRYTKKNSLNIADISCTSFFPSKNLGSFGDGGAIFTNDKNIYKKISILRNHGQTKYSYTSTHIGLNSRIGTIQASILMEKLKKFNQKLKIKLSFIRNIKIFFKKIK